MISDLTDSIRLAKDIDDPRTRKTSLMRIAGGLQDKHELRSLYIEIVTHAIKAADEIRDSQHRIHALLGIVKDVPGIDEFHPLQLKALRSALNLANAINQPQPEKHLLDNIAKTLPKSCDVSFYRQYTLLGIAKEIPPEGKFLDLYKEAMKHAIAAAITIEEPFYRKYALCFIAEELKKTTEMYALYRHTIMHAFEAASAISDPLVKMHSMIDILKIFPKTSDFFPLLQQALKDILNFYSLRRRIRDITAMEIIDIILFAEDKGIRETKKTRFTKNRYANVLARELEEFGLLLNDIRFIDILKPYTHVWIQPKELRTAASRIVDHLEGLKLKYHGREIERPVLVREYSPDRRELDSPFTEAGTAEKECISIDLGATNTVIMKKKIERQPEFISLDSISRKYNEVPIIPTALNIRTDAIGTAAGHDADIANFKKMLLEENPQARAYMERYLSILNRHLKESELTDRWSTIFSNSITDQLYITVPIGFPYYKNTVKELSERIIKAGDIQLLEEPLAAAIGYQIAEERDKIVMVIDFGGSTLDIMIVRLNINEVHVIAKPDRSKVLGGHDIDLWIAGYLAEKAGLDPEKASQELLDIAEEIKISLSDSLEAPFKWKGSEVCRISRKDLEEILEAHDFYTGVDRSISYVMWKAEKVGIKKDNIESILLTGGSSQIPSFREKIASLFPNLEEQNAIYNHSPFSAVAMGAALYSTRTITDRHLGLAYALRYITGEEETPASYEIIFGKGDTFPFERTYRISPARTLHEQKEIYLEFFEVPERYIIRRWEKESGMEFIKQVLKPVADISFKPLKIITLGIPDPLDELDEDVEVTFCVDDSGNLNIRYGKEGKEAETGIRLQ